AVGMEGGDVEVDPAVAVHIAPGCPVAANAGEVGEQPGLVADVPEDEWVLRTPCGPQCRQEDAGRSDQPPMPLHDRFTSNGRSGAGKWSTVRAAVPNPATPAEVPGDVVLVALSGGCFSSPPR